MSTIAFIATGDELVNGDLLNTNGQKMSQQLFDLGYDITSHHTCLDVEDSIAASMTFLLQNNKILIITGGLGPTSAVILPNANGSADACYIERDTQLIFMLPGPPHECLPLFNEHVLPIITAHYQPRFSVFKKWRLLGVSESLVAEKVEAIVKDTACQVGYRASYPHLEIKLKLFDQADVSLLEQKISNTISASRLPHPNQTACESLHTWLATHDRVIYIDDQITHGLLAKQLISPETKNKLQFTETTGAHHHFTLTGCEQYWLEDPNNQCLTITINASHQHTVIYRYQRTIDYIVEYLAWMIYQQITECHR